MSWNSDLQLPQKMNDKEGKADIAVFPWNFKVSLCSFVLFNKSGSLSLNRTVTIFCFFAGF